MKLIWDLRVRNVSFEFELLVILQLVVQSPKNRSEFTIPIFSWDDSSSSTKKKKKKKIVMLLGGDDVAASPTEGEVDLTPRTWTLQQQCREAL